MDEVTVYATTLQAIRRTADDCRRMISLLEAFGVNFSVMHIDTPEARTFLKDLLARNSTPPRPLTLPLCFVGPVLVGSYEDLFAVNEEEELPAALREKGYAGAFRRGVSVQTPVGHIALAPPHKDTLTHSNVEEKEDGEDEDEEPPPPPPEEDEEEEKEKEEWKEENKEEEVGSNRDGADSAIDSNLLDSDGEHYSAEDNANNKGNDRKADVVIAHDEDEDDLPPPPPSDDEEMESDEDDLPPPPPSDDEEMESDEDELPPPPPSDDDE